MGGYQQLVRGEPFRGKFRNSLVEAGGVHTGKAAKIEFSMPDIATRFGRGTGSWCRFRARGFRWWIAIRSSSWIFRRPRRRTS